nr:MAG TPA: hypothetical protein [Caudoviricetes sp.]
MEFSGKDCFDSPFCVIIVLVLRIAFIGRRRPFMGGSFFVHLSVHLFQKTTKINKNKNYKNLVKSSFCSFHLFLYFTSFRWQGTFLSL